MNPKSDLKNICEKIEKIEELIVELMGVSKDKDLKSLERNLKRVLATINILKMNFCDIKDLLEQ